MESDQTQYDGQGQEEDVRQVSPYAAGALREFLAGIPGELVSSMELGGAVLG